MAKIDGFFRLMNSQGASDLHLVSGMTPCLRIQGDLEPLNYRKLDDEELLAMLEEITPAAKFQEFLETGDVDVACGQEILSVCHAIDIDSHSHCAFVNQGTIKRIRTGSQCRRDQIE